MWVSQRVLRELQDHFWGILDLPVSGGGGGGGITSLPWGYLRDNAMLETGCKCLTCSLTFEFSANLHMYKHFPKEFLNFLLKIETLCYVWGLAEGGVSVTVLGDHQKSWWPFSLEKISKSCVEALKRGISWTATTCRGVSWRESWVAQRVQAIMKCRYILLTPLPKFFIFYESPYLSFLRFSLFFN